MSSILKALKKLESEKSQRDELSTAVASDILRSPHGRKRHAAVKVALGVAVVLLCAAGGYLFALHTASVQPMPPVDSHDVLPRTPAESRDVVPGFPSKPATTAPSLDAVMPRDLPRLSGIIYQPEPQDRLAVINDLPVMEGTLVAEFEIKSIQPDRVVLVRSGTEYVLHLEQ